MRSCSSSAPVPKGTPTLQSQGGDQLARAGGRTRPITSMLMGRRSSALMMSSAIVASGFLAGAATGAGASTGLKVQVTPSTSLFDQPLHLAVSGLPAGEVVTIALQADSASGPSWGSSATFRASNAGTVDLATSAALGGSYTGLSPWA